VNSQGLCETTLTERFTQPTCLCPTYPGNLGPCKGFEAGANGRCVWCDHNADCHRALLRSMEIEERVKVLCAARKALGTAFHDNQALAGAGCDCLGLLLIAYKDVFPDVTIPRYSAQHHLHKTEEIYLNSRARSRRLRDVPRRQDL
jgi:hypothetical protein